MIADQEQAIFFHRSAIELEATHMVIDFLPPGTWVHSTFRRVAADIRSPIRSEIVRCVSSGTSLRGLFSPFSDGESNTRLSVVQPPLHSTEGHKSGAINVTAQNIRGDLVSGTGPRAARHDFVQGLSRDGETPSWTRTLHDEVPSGAAEDVPGGRQQAKADFGKRLSRGG